jgi:hypothetical protein
LDACAIAFGFVRRSFVGASPSVINDSAKMGSRAAPGVELDLVDDAVCGLVLDQVRLISRWNSDCAAMWGR